MIRGFTFERALSWPFTAPHVASFPWIFGAVYALVYIVVLAFIATMGAGDFIKWINLVEAADGSSNPEDGIEAVFGGFGLLMPWIILSSVASWVIWAMFETASQRRYIRGERFSLGFGADELRMMVVGLFWSLLGLVIIGLPIFLIMGSTFIAMFSDPIGFESTASAEQIGLQVMGVFFVMLVLFPVYIFFATRLAPCFGLTIRENRIRFLDAWNVSRGRFWPIFGAYVILAIAGSIAGQVIAGIAQTIMMPATLRAVENIESTEDFRAVIFSSAFLVPVGIYSFITLFIQGVLQHAVGGPAAFAVRHDPRGGIEAENQIGAFD